MILVVSNELHNNVNRRSNLVGRIVTHSDWRESVYGDCLMRSSETAESQSIVFEDVKQLCVEFA